MNKLKGALPRGARGRPQPKKKESTPVTEPKARKVWMGAWVLRQEHSVIGKTRREIYGHFSTERC